jgi:hypothetical protein
MAGCETTRKKMNRNRTLFNSDWWRSLTSIGVMKLPTDMGSGTAATINTPRAETGQI